VVCRHARQVTFHLGATSATRRPYKKMLLPLMAAAEWAHDVGAEVFDLGGVPRPEDDDPKRRAIAQFKFDFARTHGADHAGDVRRPTAIGEGRPLARGAGPRPAPRRLARRFLAADDRQVHADLHRHGLAVDHAPWSCR
jgi:hypothetical protein